MEGIIWKSSLVFWAVLVVGYAQVVKANDTDVKNTAIDFEAAFQGKCGPSSPCVQLCVELHDGTFECQCRSGFTLLRDGYSCVEMGNSTDEDSEEFDSDLEFNSAQQIPRKSEGVVRSGILKGPLPRPLASSTLPRSPSEGAEAAAKAAEQRERNNYLKKFSPIDPQEEIHGTFPMFDLDASLTITNHKVKGQKVIEAAKKAATGGEEGNSNESSQEDEDDEDEEDSTNEAEEDLESLEKSNAKRSSPPSSSKGKETGGGGEEDSESDEDFILPPRALPLLIPVLSGQGQRAFYAPSSVSVNVNVNTGSKGESEGNSNANSNAPTEVSKEQTEDNQKKDNSVVVDDCPLKCGGGVCTKELWDENQKNSDDKMNIGFRCLCPLGKRGTFCEIEEQFEEGGGYNSGLFRGKSWVAFPVLHDAYMSDQISLEFRPQSPNGILLLTGERDDLSGDYLALFLIDGFLEFRFDCGSGSGMVRSSKPVNLEQWNKASIIRRRWDGWMQLNDGPFTQGRSKGLFSRITFRQPVYIGGQGNITFNSVSSIQSNFDEEPEFSSSSSTINYNGSFSSSDGPLSTIAPGSDAESPSSSVMSKKEEEIQEEKQREESYPFSSSSSNSAGIVGASETDESTVNILKRIQGFRGCIRNLVINDRVYRFGLEPAGDSLQGFDIENCNDQGVCDLVKCQHGGQCLVQKDENPTCLCPLGFSGPLCETPLDLQIPSFNGSSYLKYGGLGLTRVLSWLELEIVIKPDAMDGLIMYNGYKTDGMGDFISLCIDQGYIEFAMDLGTGTAIIRSDMAVALGEWHHIHVSRTSRLISLRIDNQPPLMALTPGAFTQLSLPHNLFLGGIPDPQWLSPKVKVHGGFSGCIQKLVINEKPLRIMGSAMSGVNLENCAHPCLRNPCSHGGDCIPQLDTFKCHCPLGYRDTYCETRMDKEDTLTPPRFIGDSYLKFTHPRIIKRLSGWRLNLSFRMKTDLSRGLLVWAGRKWMTSASDFISMGLRNGFVTASFSLGSGQITIAYNSSAVNDGRWHRVHLIRNEQEASLSVDDGPPVTGVAPGKLRQLNINDGLYIGGLEEARHQSMNRYTEGFVGCLTDVVLGSERVLLLQEASQGRNVDYCD